MFPDGYWADGYYEHGYWNGGAGITPPPPVPVIPAVVLDGGESRDDAYLAWLRRIPNPWARLLRRFVPAQQATSRVSAESIERDDMEIMELTGTRYKRRRTWRQ